MPILPPENLLRDALSPYLLQHAGNPVHWRPWGRPALEEAAATDRPILLSIGYAACHWCHVMARESFEDLETAGLMNALYVCIKVDREERPEIDALYMNALQLMGEPGGWPLTMMLTPAGEPFWGGTYFPPAPRQGRPSFRQVLRGVAEAYRTEGDKVRQNVAALRQALGRLAAARPGPLPSGEALAGAAGDLLRHLDPIEGGLAGAPKFPSPPLFRFLWQMGQRLGAPACAEAVALLLRRMSQGGLYDHLGGGYARYSTDALWLVPHFEKMLSDNAQLLELLALLQAARPDPRLAARAAETVGWLQREMIAEGGGFAASQDADSEGEEGRFYVWSAAEVAALLGPRAEAFARVYDVTPGGKWDGRCILNRRQAPEALPAAEEARLAEDRARLLAARAKRPAPGRDDKVLADWNGLAITALARAANVFRQPAWLALAQAAFDAVAGHLVGPDGRLRHACRQGQASAAGLLEDHAAMARAALALFEATGEPALLDRAIGWAEQVERHFAAPGGGYFTSAADAADIPLRGRSAADQATPSGNGLMAEVQARLFHLTGEDRWRRLAEATIGAFSGEAGPVARPGLLVAADLLTEAATVVVTGDPGDPRTQALAEAVLAHPDLATLLLRGGTGRVPPDHPAAGPAAGKGLVEGQPAAYVCRAGRCGLPLTSPVLLRRALARPPGTPVT